LLESYSKLSRSPGGHMSNELLCLATATALLSLVGTANGREAVRLTDVQLDKVTAGANTSQESLIASFVSNGNGSGVSLFSPAIAIVVPTIADLNICVLCVTTPTRR
jgi:hypothetical protein